MPDLKLRLTGTPDDVSLAADRLRDVFEILDEQIPGPNSHPQHEATLEIIVRPRPTSPAQLVNDLLSPLRECHTADLRKVGWTLMSFYSQPYQCVARMLTKVLRLLESDGDDIPRVADHIAEWKGDSWTALKPSHDQPDRKS